jgi:hypothetical protein
VPADVSKAREARERERERGGENSITTRGELQGRR